MMNRMLVFMKEHRKMILIIGCIMLCVFAAFSIAVHTKLIDLGLDTFTRPKEYTSHESILTTDGYARLTASKSKFDVEDTITLTIHSAYYDSIEDALQASYVSASIRHCDYLEVMVVGADDFESREDVQNSEFPLRNDMIAIGIFTQFDPDDLVYQSMRPFDFVTKNSLRYTITITIKVLEGAPENFTDELIIGTRSDANNGYYDLGVGTTARVFLKFVRDGDTVKIYA